jgi:uncharacterized protein YndB with AHSA1/START domain
MNNKSFFRRLLACVAVVCLANTIYADTRTVEKQVLVAASPERVLRSFVDGTDLEGWWKVSRSLVQQHPGGVWSVVWDDYGEAKTQHSWVGVVEEISPRRLRIGHLVMIEPGRPLFGPLELEFVVGPADGGSSLTVYHRGYRSGEQWDWMHDTVVQGWDHVLGDLQQWFRDGEAVDPDRHE